MRISYWSSDVCSSVLLWRVSAEDSGRAEAPPPRNAHAAMRVAGGGPTAFHDFLCGHRTNAADPLGCHPRARPEGPFRRGTEPLRKGQVLAAAWIAGTSPAMTA